MAEEPIWFFSKGSSTSFRWHRSRRSVANLLALWAIPARVDEPVATRIRETAAQFPYLVCEKDGEIIGYAYAHRIRERAAYDWDAELSVYLKQGTHGRGIGTVLLACLIELLEMQGLRHLYSCVTMPNPRSVGMQHRLGFEDAGVWHKSGWKFGAWHDVAWFEKHVGGGEPKPVVPFPELDGDNIQKTLNIYTEKLNLEDK